MTSPTTFTVTVSRLAKGKDGYNNDKWAFGNSFHPETHTIESLAEVLAEAGYPITMNHHRITRLRADEKKNIYPASGLKLAGGRLVHNPRGDAYPASGLRKTTYRVTENFVSMQVIGLDDDRQISGVVQSWLSDAFFSQYGALLYESSSSKPDAEKARPIFVLDRPITSPAEVKEILLAFHYRYPHTDRINDAARVWYGAPESNCHILNNVLPYEVLECEILEPYRAHLAERQAIEEAERQKRLANKVETLATDDKLENYARRSIQGILNRMASATDGERHSLNRWQGIKLGELAGAEWVKAEWIAGLEDAAIDAAKKAGGYCDAEIKRTFEWGYDVGQAHPAEKPTFYERVTAAGGDEGAAYNVHEVKPPKYTLPPYTLPAEAIARRERILADLPPQLTPLSFEYSILPPELEKCEIATEHYVWTSEGGKGTTYYYCNDATRCALCRERKAIKLKFYLEELAKLAYVDENGNAAIAIPEMNEAGEFVTKKPGPGFWYGKVISQEKRRAWTARYKRHKPGGFIKPEVYPVKDGQGVKCVVLSLAPFEDMEPVKLTNDLLERITMGAEGTKASLLFCPPRDQLDRALPRYSFELAEYLHERGLVATIKAPHSVLFTGPIKKDDIYSSFNTKAKTFDEIGLILEEIALKSIDEDRLRGEDDHAPDYVIQSVHIVEEAKPAYLAVYNAGREGDQETIKRYKRGDLPKLPTLKSECVDKAIYNKITIALSTQEAILEEESPDYYARLEYLLQTEGI